MIVQFPLLVFSRIYTREVVEVALVEPPGEPLSSHLRCLSATAAPIVQILINIQFSKHIELTTISFQGDVEKNTFHIQVFKVNNTLFPTDDICRDVEIKQTRKIER